MLKIEILEDFVDTLGNVVGVSVGEIVADIVANGVLDKHLFGVLMDVDGVVSQLLGKHVTGVVAEDPYRSAVGILQASYQAEECRFPGAVGSDQRDPFITVY